jgi:hypothetical protein
MDVQAVARRPIHRRTVNYSLFQRDDGLIDVECSLADVKPFDCPDRERVVVPAGQPFHHIVCRLTVDSDGVVAAVAVEMLSRPFGECDVGAAAATGLVGRSLLKGWRRSLAEVLGGTCSCTHLREMLGGAPTAFMQALYGVREAGRPDTDRDPTVKPYWVGGCFAWAPASTATRRYFPAFAQPPEDAGEVDPA